MQSNLIVVGFPVLIGADKRLGQRVPMEIVLVDVGDLSVRQLLSRVLVGTSFLMECKIRGFVIAAKATRPPFHISHPTPAHCWHRNSM